MTHRFSFYILKTLHYKHFSKQSSFVLCAIMLITFCSLLSHDVRFHFKKINGQHTHCIDFMIHSLTYSVTWALPTVRWGARPAKLNGAQAQVSL